ncbi:MAG: cation transporter [Phycisphaeraceae bacterium]|nr:cation transporter [Phycisphaeraceae bacterium]
MINAKCQRCANHAIWACLWGNVFLCLFKGGIGFITGSMALVADAVHSAADVLDSLVAMVATRLGSKPPDKKHPYGYGKIEFVAGAFIGIVLSVSAAIIVVTSIGKVLSPEELPPPHFIALVAAAMSILLNEMLFRFAICAGRAVNSAALEAEAWDNRADCLSSVPVFIGVLGAQMGFLALDPLCAVLVGVMVGKVGFELLNKNLHGLIDAPLSDDECERIHELVTEIPGVQGIDWLKTRGMGRHYLADLQILVTPGTPIEISHGISAKVKRTLLDKFHHLGEVMIACKPGDGEAYEEVQVDAIEAVGEDVEEEASAEQGQATGDEHSGDQN